MNKVGVILDEVIKKVPSFTITINTIGAFPKITSPRVIWAGINNGDKETKEIAQKLEERITEIGIPKEERQFSSHITLGRTRSVLNLDKLVVGLKKIELLGRDQRQEFLASKIDRKSVV